VLAHAGGIDEIILGVGVVMLFLLFRSSRAERGAGGAVEGPCLYCGHPLSAGMDRCPECGFRALRGVTSSTSAEER
jgi:hypothetical protein